MLDSLRRALFPPRADTAPEARPLAEWARRAGHVWKRARGDDGFVIEGALEGAPWRIEWGPPQRDYLGGRELRLRIEAGLPSSAQMLVLTRELVASLERRTFEAFTDTLQTQVDATTPEEMRWLVIFPKVDLAASPVLRQHFGAVASSGTTAQAWLEGPLAARLEAAIDTPAGLLRGAPPFVLMTLRGRVYLRMRLDDPSVADVAAALALFETAVTAAQRAAGRKARRGAEASALPDADG